MKRQMLSHRASRNSQKSISKINFKSKRKQKLLSVEPYDVTKTAGFEKAMKVWKGILRQYEPMHGKASTM